jgi:phage terminase large subunit
MMDAVAEAKTTEAMAELYAAYKADWVFFVEHALGHYTWSKQREILESVQNNPETAVRACHGVSKTFTAAEIAVIFLNCIEHSKVITTAPTFTQVKDLLWAEINAIYTRSRIKLLGECLVTEIKTNEPDSYAIGFSSDKPARSEGWHAPAILFIFDEAKGLPQWAWDSARGAMTGGFCRFLAISTTDGVQVGEQYHKIFTEKKGNWNRIHISAHDSPYVTGEKFRSIEIPDPSRPDIFKTKFTDPKDVVIQIASPGWIQKCKDDWGEDSVLYQTKVLGEISDAGSDSIIKLSQILKMFANAQNAAFDATGQEEMGIDVARGGADDTTFWRRKGMKITDFRVITSSALPEKAKTDFIAKEAEAFVDCNKEVRIKVDDTGVGGGVTDILQADGYNAIPVNFGASAKDPDKYPNTIAEMWHEVGALIGEISCPENSRLQTELANRKRLPLDKKGRRVVESKDDYKKRGFRSPDVADGFLLAFYNPAKSGNIGFEVA